MPTERTAAEIKSRFDSEQAYIRQSVEYAQLRSTLEDGRIAELSYSLREKGLPQLQQRAESRFDELFSPDEIAALLASIETATPAVQKALREHEEKEAGEYRFLTPHGTIDSHADLYSEWVNYIITQQVPSEPTEKNVTALREFFLRQALEQSDRAGGITEAVLANVIHDAVDTVLDIKWRAKGGALQNALDHFDELRLIARFATPDAEINLLRQNFILMMTAFDAAIFDLMRVKLRKDFFTLISLFGKDDKVPYKKFAEAGTYDRFRDTLIEEQLKRRYVKDLLLIIQGMGKKLTDEAAGDRFVDLIEIVLRRNVHVHNRGIVDDRYLEKNDKGKLEYDIYGLKPGDPAPIDQAYWDKANRLCSNCVADVAEWAEP